ncbi:MAG: hypothetical protein ACLPTZ_17600 [Beijerinckiaceae bacterium]
MAKSQFFDLAIRIGLAASLHEDAMISQIRRVLAASTRQINCCLKIITQNTELFVSAGYFRETQKEDKGQSILADTCADGNICRQLGNYIHVDRACCLRLQPKYVNNGGRFLDTRIIHFDFCADAALPCYHL